ncbi:glycosyltransferase family 39 protein [Draconibacterium orientale]|uniref:glycosyltransferase family 39 protein n=1 Tax=Draconibacterium orientale TaxID=1168034 RepID=UPI0029BFB94E|nr:glycosyltransferase family 39 protein [Draconibacterium orientale]
MYLQKNTITNRIKGQYKASVELLLILAMCTVGLFTSVGMFGVIETSDARYAEIAREMLESGDYLNPTLLGIKHYHKPPLTYYITVLGYSLYGITAFAARFFVQLAILVQLVFVYLLSVQLFNSKTSAVWAAIIYFSFPIVLISSRNLTTDPYLATFVILSMYFWVRYRKSAISVYLYLFALSLALGFLTKGPLIFIVPLVFVISYNYIQPSSEKFTLHHIFSLLLFVLIAGSWFYLLIRQNNDFVKYFVGHHTIDRFATNDFGRGKPFWYYLAIVPAVGIPWLFFLPFLVYKNWEKIIKDKLYVVLGAGIVIPFLFFSVASSKLVPYILPLFSLFAILSAQLIRQFGLSKTQYYLIVAYSILIALVGIAGAVLQFNFNIPNVVLFLSAVALIALYLINKYILSYNSRVIYTVYAVSLLMLLSSGFLLSKNQIEINSTQPLAEFILDNELNNNEILVYNKRLPSISFHLQKPIVSIYDGNKDLNREVQFEENRQWKQNLINLKDETELDHLKQIMAKKKTILIIYKNRIPDNRKWLLDFYSHSKDYNKWQIYY